MEHIVIPILPERGDSEQGGTEKFKVLMITEPGISGAEILSRACSPQHVLSNQQNIL